METMETSEVVSVVSAVLAGFSVFIPLLLMRAERRDRLQAARRFVDLFDARDGLCRIRDSAASEGAPPAVTRKLDRLLDEVNGEIARATERIGRDLFLLAAFVECLLVVGILFAEYTAFLERLLSAPSSESGMKFLEGTFRYPAMRIGLLMLSISLAVWLAGWIGNRWVRRWTEDYDRYNLALLAVFNVACPVIVVALGVVLWALDPIVPLW